MLHCYYMNLCCDCSKEQSQAFYEELPEERQERIRHMKNPVLAKKKILTGHFLQVILQEETGIELRKQRYVYNEIGRPSLADRTVDFNLSDSGDYVVLAVSDRAVGIDIERRKKNHLTIAKRCFCPEEYEDIAAAGGPEQQELRFRKYWTMKEAYVKCMGSGLTIPLHSFRVVWDEGYTRSHIIIEESSESAVVAYGYTTLLPGQEEEYCVSVCQQEPVEEVSLTEIRKGCLHDRNFSA